ncbi:hypothetical protein PHYSODRAFT_247544 [Phytophthora sojae]|uniref:Uncharacterized protein n=1 Tax=Phytophthora sojae (strain P6497) TaxID=1094619 RepID=G5AFG4_PHYSP|nr:hypothetical protein PHYSODRAFT_247544 [Phytophthora sojae]EGZ05954.1 hypothetical protein PHYSODRAFT_247544 [Phytophthora sojae]|eukprot:XP_009538815.1 hypothetical protein PHYSODRAFT_247544 [Phytophthora sojae]
MTSLSVTTPEKDKLIALSVDALDASPKMSSSLALEREQLEKRKRQMDTANAVAAMNTRLSQLGLLKSAQKTTPPAQPRQEDKTTLDSAATLPVPATAKSVSSTAFKSSIPAPKPITKEATVLAESNVAGTPPTPSSNSVVNSNEALRTQVAECSISSSDENADKVTNDLVDQALGVLNSQEPPMPPPVNDQVTASLSVHTQGYGSQTTRQVGESIDFKSRPANVPTLEVDASLSSFTMGFKTSPQPSQDSTNADIVKRSVAVNASVASSLSAFTAGYGGEIKAENSKAAPPSDVSVDESMSAFTMGYSAAAVSPVKVPAQIPVDVSLSNFTSGYGVAKDDASVTPEAVRPPSVASANALEALGNLYQPLEDAAMALEKELATRSSQDPKVFEIRALIESLRSAIADLASPS